RSLLKGFASPHQEGRTLENIQYSEIAFLFFDTETYFRIVSQRTSEYRFATPVSTDLPPSQMR
ncbi:MAG: hypothetical protein RSD95_08095, partial [Clostridia bacterium]